MGGRKRRGMERGILLVEGRGVQPGYRVSAFRQEKGENRLCAVQKKVDCLPRETERCDDQTSRPAGSEGHPATFPFRFCMTCPSPKSLKRDHSLYLPEATHSPYRRASLMKVTPRINRLFTLSSSHSCSLPFSSRCSSASLSDMRVSSISSAAWTALT